MTYLQTSRYNWGVQYEKSTARMSHSRRWRESNDKNVPTFILPLSNLIARPAGRCQRGACRGTVTVDVVISTPDSSGSSL